MIEIQSEHISCEYGDNLTSEEVTVSSKSTF